MQERIFKKFFDVAEISNLSKEEYAKYFESEKVYYDNDGAIRTAEAKGRAEGRAEGLAEGEKRKALEVARTLKSMGMSTEDIAKATQLSWTDINAL